MVKIGSKTTIKTYLHRIGRETNNSSNSSKFHQKYIIRFAYIINNSTAYL